MVAMKENEMTILAITPTNEGGKKAVQVMAQVTTLLGSEEDCRASLFLSVCSNATRATALLQSNSLNHSLNLLEQREGGVILWVR